MKRFDTFGAYMFELLFAPLKRGKRAANQFFIFFKVIGRIFDGMKKDAFRLRDELNVATASPVMLQSSQYVVVGIVLRDRASFALTSYWSAPTSPS